MSYEEKTIVNTAPRLSLPTITLASKLKKSFFKNDDSIKHF